MNIQTDKSFGKRMAEIAEAYNKAMTEAHNSRLIHYIIDTLPTAAKKGYNSRKYFCRSGFCYNTDISQVSKTLSDQFGLKCFHDEFDLTVEW